MGRQSPDVKIWSNGGDNPSRNLTVSVCIAAQSVVRSYMGCGPETGRSRITWEFVKKAES